MPKVRTTLSLDAELLARFQAVADLERRSLSSFINAWLEQVLPAAEWVGSMAAQERATGMKNMQAILAALQVAQEEAVATVRKAAREAQAEDRARRPGGQPGSRQAHGLASSPPSCNTGGKLPAKAPRAGGKRS